MIEYKNSAYIIRNCNIDTNITEQTRTKVFHIFRIRVAWKLKLLAVCMCICIFVQNVHSINYFLALFLAAVKLFIRRDLLLQTRKQHVRQIQKENAT